MASKSIEIKNQIIQILKVQGVVPKMLVPFVWGPPGSGKSDLTEAIAKELDYQHIDIRLTHYDESVVCGYPYLEEGDCGKPIDRDGSNKAYFKKGWWKRYDRKKFFRNISKWFE